uniref:Membrane protein, putative n=2 Tax=Babesia bovis TaxID=5865 RepID=A7AP38_BABBO|eukprot:XP_001611890.1 membrane protein [Babesia bovis T2Bo]
MKICCSAAVVTLCLTQLQTFHAQSIQDFQIKDLLSGRWLEELKPTRENAENIAFEAFDAGYEAKKDDKQTNPMANVGIFGGDMSKIFPPHFRRHYCYFLFLCAALIQYAIIGYVRIKRKVQHILEKQVPILADNFAHIADGPYFYERQKIHKYCTYASGRTSCESLLISFTFVKRQCPWHEFLITPLFFMNDIMTIDAILPNMDPIAFAITNKLTNKAFIKANEEVANTMYVHETTDLPTTHRSYINSTEKCVTKYASYAIAMCQEFMPQLIALYVVDALPDVQGYRQVNRVSIAIRLNKDVDLPAKVLKAMISLVDYTKNFALTDKTKESINKSRKSMITVIFKNQMKKQQEEARAENTVVTPEKIKKIEKKQAAKPTRRVKMIK